MSNFDLHNKTILVAGAAGLLGKKLTFELLAAGANVVALDYNKHSLQLLEKEHAEKSSLMCVATDVTDIHSINRAFQEARVRFGTVNGAVNTAYPRNSNYGNKFFDVTYEDFCANISLNLGCYFLFMQQCAKYAVENEAEFSLVNISSIYGVVAPKFEIYDETNMTMPVEYAAIKSALIHLSKYVVSYVGRSQFRVNLVSPGGILDRQPRAFLDAYKKQTLGKGMLDVSDVLGAIIYLLSDASRFINGQNLIVDDGFSL